MLSVSIWTVHSTKQSWVGFQLSLFSVFPGLSLFYLLSLIRSHCVFDCFSSLFCSFLHLVILSPSFNINFFPIPSFFTNPPTSVIPPLKQHSHFCFGIWNVCPFAIIWLFMTSRCCMWEAAIFESWLQPTVPCHRNVLTVGIGTDSSMSGPGLCQFHRTWFEASGACFK